jgi:hypothetical protein
MRPAQRDHQLRVAPAPSKRRRSLSGEVSAAPAAASSSPALPVVGDAYLHNMLQKRCGRGVAEPSSEYDGDTREAAGKLLCATTLSSLDAAIVMRRRRRMTSFAFPSGGRARQRQLLGSTFIGRRVIVIGTHASLSRSHPARVPCPLDLHLLCSIAQRSIRADSGGGGAGGERAARRGAVSRAHRRRAIEQRSSGLAAPAAALPQQ